MAVSTRSATVEDAPGIAAAHMRGWQVAYQGIVPDDFLDAIVLSERIERWRENLESTELPNGLPAPSDYVVEVDGQVVGFANVGVFRKEANNPLAAELWAMYVHPDHWGTGAGYALMQATTDQFTRDAIEIAYLWVLEDNAQARRFYERQGWSADAVTEIESIGGVEIISRRYSLALS